MIFVVFFHSSSLRDDLRSTAKYPFLAQKCQISHGHQCRLVHIFPVVPLAVPPADRRPRGSNRPTHSRSRRKKSIKTGRSYRFRSIGQGHLDVKGDDTPSKMSPADTNAAGTNPTTVATASISQRRGEDSTALFPRSDSHDQSGLSDSREAKPSLKHVGVPVPIGLSPPTDDTKSGGRRDRNAHVKFDLPAEDSHGIAHGSGESDRSTAGGNNEFDLEGDEAAVDTSTLQTGN